MKTLGNEHRDSFPASPLFEQSKALKLASVRGFKKSETSPGIPASLALHQQIFNRCFRFGRDVGERHRPVPPVMRPRFELRRRRRWRRALI